MRSLNLGAGNSILVGFDNHDFKKHRDEIDIVFDLDKFPYPILDNTYNNVRAIDVLEHLENPLEAVNEIHRILKPNGVFFAKCCGWKNPNFWVDITHKKAFDINSMDYLDIDTDLGKQYDYYTDRKWKILLKVEDRNKNPQFKMKKI